MSKITTPAEQTSENQYSGGKDTEIRPIETLNNQPQRLADFETLTKALEYAATGCTGFNFYDARGRLKSVLTELRDSAKETALRLLGLGLQRGQHVAIIADTTPEFVILFFACRYAGLVPFAMPVPVNLGSHNIYVKQLQGMLSVGQAVMAIANKEYISFLEEASSGVDTVNWVGTPEQLSAIPASEIELQENSPEETAYLQFTSGSTRMPQGVIITEQAVMSNIQGIVRNGLDVKPDDRCASWLPFYHDMGLIGLV
ncbi:MAG: AMP-binding protein, partial [Gammaproteobacteria bacterium]|nr:AMP-binding protein [Gammaproteobacteria bacterium]NIO61491.1 AMP-binding protein [Gammaproteobacteria bacterium]